MNLKTKLFLIQEELDSIQCFVQLELNHTSGEVDIKAESQVDRLLAKHEVEKAGFKVSMLCPQSLTTS